jgi:fumarate reductase subunit D
VSAVFIFVGNALPKILTPLSMLSREQAELVTTARRFIGRVFVVFGLVTALAFLMAPVELAAALLKWATGSCLLTILGAVVWMNVTPTRRKQ